MKNDILTYIMDIGNVTLRSLSSLVILFLLTRIMGKKQISQLTFFDYVVGITIGSIAADMATNKDVNYIHELTGIIVYALIAVFISIITNKSINARRFFTGHTFLLIDKGKILEKNLMLVNYDINDLLSEARNLGYFNISDIEYALLETNGKISFLPKANKQPATLEDLNIQSKPLGLCANVIIDGVIMKENLKSTGLDEIWLKNELAKQNIHDAKDVILGSVDSQNILTIFKKTHQEIKKTFID